MHPLSLSKSRCAQPSFRCGSGLRAGCSACIRPWSVCCRTVCMDSMERSLWKCRLHGLPLATAAPLQHHWRRVQWLQLASISLAHIASVHSAETTYYHIGIWHRAREQQSDSARFMKMGREVMRGVKKIESLRRGIRHKHTYSCLLSCYYLLLWILCRAPPSSRVLNWLPLHKS